MAAEPVLLVVEMQAAKDPDLEGLIQRRLVDCSLVCRGSLGGQGTRGRDAGQSS